VDKLAAKTLKKMDVLGQGFSGIGCRNAGNNNSVGIFTEIRIESIARRLPDKKGKRLF